MQLVYTLSPPQAGGEVEVLANGLPAIDVEVQLVEGKATILVADPISWGVIAAAVFEKFAGSFADAAGKEIGSAFGKWVAERLGFGGSNNASQIKAILDAFTKKVVESIRQQFVEQQFRVAHEGLAATARQLDNFMLAPKTETLAGLTNLDLEVARVYEQLKNLGEGALPSLCRAGTMLVVIAVRLYGKTGDKGQARVALGRIEEVLADIDGRLAKITELFDARVLGPYATTSRETCVDLVPDPVHSEPLASLILLPRRVIPIRYTVDAPAYGVSVDGAPSLFLRTNDPCGKNRPNIDAEAMTAASGFADGHRVPIRAELERDFLVPAIAVRTSADKLKKKLPK